MLIYRQYAQTLLTKWNSIPLQKTLRLIFENSIYGAVSKRNRTGFCPSFASKNPKRFFLFGFSYLCLGLVLLIQLCTACLIWPGYALPLRTSLPSTPSRLSSSPSSGSFSVCRCPCFLICTPYPYQT